MEQYVREILDGSQSPPGQELSKKWDLDVGTPATPDTDSGCFDCNICLDFATDPVVTLCGHLYCWPCIYKWLTLDPSSTPQCPVCKAPLSEATLVPLYGRGGDSAAKSISYKAGDDIPHRPSAYRTDGLVARTTSSASSPPPQSHHQRQVPRSPNHYHHHHHQYYPPSSPSPLHLRSTTRLLHPMSGGGGGGMAYALLPWVFGWLFGCPEPGIYYSDSYYLSRDEDNVRARRQEIQAGRSLSRISIFLLCGLGLCLFLF